MKINRFAIIYLMIVSIAFVSVREAIQSQYFANFVSKKVSNWAKENIDGEVNIGQIKIEAFPFGMALQDVSLDIETLNLEAAKISVIYGLQNIFKSDIYIDDVILEQGSISISNNVEKNENNDEDINSTIKKISKDWPEYFDKISSLPVKVENIALKNMFLNRDTARISITNGKISYNEKIYLDLLIEKIVDDKASALGYVLPDSLHVKINADKKTLTIDDLKIQKGFAKIKANGAISISDNLRFVNLNVSIIGPDQAYFEILPQKYEFDETFKAYSNSNLLINGSLDNPEFLISLDLQNIEGKYLLADRLKTNIKFFENRLIVNNINIKDGDGSIDISSATPLNLEKAKELNISNVDIVLKDFHTKTIFHFLKGRLDAFDAFLTGQVSANIAKSKIALTSYEGLEIDNLRLLIDPAEPLIQMKSSLLQNLKLEIDLEPFSLVLNTDWNLPTSLMKVDALIDDKGISAKLISDTFSFDDFKQIQNVPIAGDGKLNVNINGPWDNIEFDLDGNLKKTQIAGYMLGELEFKGELPLKQKRLSFTKLKAKKGSTELTGKIDLELSDKPYPLKIEYSAQKATYNDLIEILDPIVPSDFKNYKDIQARFKSDGKVAIDFKKKPVKLDLNVLGNSFSYQGEYFDSFSANILMNAGRMNLRNFTLQREDSKGTGSVIWDTDTSYLEYEFSMNKLSLRSFSIYRLSPLSLDGNINFDLYGSGLLNSDHSMRATMILDDSKIKRKRVPNSRLDAYFSKGEWTLQAELMEGMSRIEAFVPPESSKKDTLVRFDISSADIRPLVGLLSPERMSEETLYGRVFLQIQSSFPLSKPEVADVKIDIRDIDINYKRKKFKLKRSNQVNVNKGIFKNWSFLSADESDLVLTSKANGDLGGSFSLNSSYRVPAQFLELFSDSLVDSSGVINGLSNIDWNQNGIKAIVNHQGSNLEFKLKEIPGRFSDLVFEANYEDDSFNISNLSGKYGRGDFQIYGNIKADFPYPNINLKLSSTNVTFPFFNKSEANFDNRFTLIGSKPPYLLSGKVVLNRVSLDEDVGTYLGKISASNNYEQFIPNTTQSFLNQFLEVDATVIANKSIRVSNPLMSLNLSTNLKLNGVITSPQILGRVIGTPAQSKIAFKGHEFELSKSVVEFSSDSGSEKPTIDLNGKTTVAGYNIDLNVNGAVDQMNILLSSEPPLPQDEIVSLLTLGITSDISRNLNEQDRRSITTMSLGGFLFDQLQLTKDLDSNLGLKVSLAPEFSGEEGNLIEEASSDTSTARRLKTGTKLRVQSQLGKKTSVSFSSTLGGEVEQRQEMNVNYDFNRKWSLEGVYELRSSSEENQIETQSLGADVKYKWSF